MKSRSARAVDAILEGRTAAFRKMHRRAQAAESRAIKRDKAATHWLRMMEAQAPTASLVLIVEELAESLAEACVTPCVGSMNPHEDTLGRALVLVPGAKAAVDRIVDMMAPEEEPASDPLGAAAFALVEAIEQDHLGRWFITGDAEALACALSEALEGKK
jgi:hypothetical protein